MRLFQFVAKKRQIYLFVHTLILPLFCKLFYCFVFVRCCLKIILHVDCKGESLRLVQDKLDSRNFYAYNPAFDGKWGG